MSQLLKDKIGLSVPMNLNQIDDRLFELTKLDQLILGFVYKNSWSQLKSKRKAGECEIQTYIPCKFSNKKLEKEVKSYLTDIKHIILFNKMASNTEETSVFMDKSEDKETYSIFIINFKMEATTSWLFWTDLHLTVSTYQATCALL